MKGRIQVLPDEEKGASSFQIEKLKRSESALRVPSEAEASFLSRCTSWWIGATINLAYDRAHQTPASSLQLVDLPRLLPQDEPQVQHANFTRHWDACSEVADHEDRPHKSLLKAMWRTIRWDLMKTLMFYVSGAAAQLSNPLLLRAMVIFIEDSQTDGKETEEAHGYILAALFFSSIAFGVLMQSFGMKQGYAVGCNIRSIFMVAVYQKALHLSARSSGRDSQEGRSAKQETKPNTPKSAHSKKHGKHKTKAETDADISSAGRMMQLMSSDAEGFLRSIYSITQAIVAPFIMAFVIYFLAKLSGVSMLAGMAGLLGLWPFIIPLAKKSKQYRKDSLFFSDRRVKLTNELVQGIKVMKFQAWEEQFLIRITKAREEEARLLTNYHICRGLTMPVTFCIPVIACMLNFITYSLLHDGNLPPAADAFAMITLYKIAATPFFIFTMGMVHLMLAMVSMKRLSRFLGLSEVPPAADEKNKPAPPKRKSTVVSGLINVGRRATIDLSMRLGWRGGRSEDYQTSNDAVDTSSSSTSGVAVQCTQQTDFFWDLKQQPTLSNIALSIPRGSLVVIVGQVGSGKSSLLAAILGEMQNKQSKKTEEEAVQASRPFSVSGSVAYVAQAAYIQNASVAANILFNTVNPSSIKYTRAVNVSALAPDLRMLPNNDATEIGEKGVNLSGGQKQRVSIARAVFADADVYLFDDPFSAVDSHVGKQLWNDVLVGELKGKTRVLVTNQLHFLDDAQVRPLTVDR
jgi:ABC-type multidrug transport system fused ATPase/permease subunit